MPLFWPVMRSVIRQSGWRPSRILAAGPPHRQPISLTAVYLTVSLRQANDRRQMMLLSRQSALPGFAPARGVTLLWLSLIVLLPLTALVLRPWELGLSGIWASVTEPRVLAA